MEETISLRELVLVLRKRMTMIISITFTAALVSAIVSFFFITPIYQTSTQILVNEKKTQGTYTPGDIQTNLQLINTYSGIIKSPAILEKVKEKLGLKIPTGSLNSMISVTNQKDSQIISVTVQDSNPKEASDIANAVGDIFKSEIPNIMSVDNVTILSKAETSSSLAPVKPRPTLNVGIAIVVGLMVSIGLSFLIEHLDNTIKKEEEIDSILELPILGVISQMEEKKQANGLVVTKVREQSVGS